MCRRFTLFTRAEALAERFQARWLLRMRHRPKSSSRSSVTIHELLSVQSGILCRHEIPYRIRDVRIAVGGRFIDEIPLFY
jgi:hypothetical protein